MFKIVPLALSTSVQDFAILLESRSPSNFHLMGSCRVLRDLHWLPVSSRIEFKIMLITYKNHMIELQSIYRNSFNCIHPAAILDPLIEIY